jgi:hypothetical protein
MRYSELALSEVSPYSISHASISRWVHDKCFRPRDLWEIANKHVDYSELSLIICDDTVLAKISSQKIKQKACAIPFLSGAGQASPRPLAEIFFD